MRKRRQKSEIKSLYGFCWCQTNDGIIHFWITWSVQIQSVHVPHPFASARYLLSLGAMAFAILRRGCVLIEHVSIFLCKDGEVTTALLLIDGLHLSETGSKALLQNIGLMTRVHVLLGRGMRRNVPYKTHDTSHHKHQRCWVSSDSGRRPLSLRPSQRDWRPYIYIPRSQWATVIFQVTIVIFQLNRHEIHSCISYVSIPICMAVFVNKTAMIWIG